MEGAARKLVPQGLNTAVRGPYNIPAVSAVLRAITCRCLACNACRFVADRLMVALGYEKIWNARNPFDWMEMISLQVGRLWEWEYSNELHGQY